MSRIGFIQSKNFNDLFKKELDILKVAIEMSEGGGIYFVEFSHKEVLYQTVFFLASKILNQGRSIEEFLLKDSLPEVRNKKEVVFVYTFIEDIKRPDPITPSEELLKKLNAMRERIASSKEDFVFWVYKDHVLLFQKIAKDIWVAKRGFYSFILGPEQLLEPLSISKEITPVEAAKLLNQAVNYERQLEDRAISIYKKIHLEKTLVSIYEKLSLLKQAEIHKTNLYKHYKELKELETIKKEYLNLMTKRYEWLDFKGIRQMKIIVKFRLEEIFVSPRFEKSDIPIGAWSLLFKARAVNDFDKEYIAKHKSELEKVKPYSEASIISTYPPNRAMLIKMKESCAPIFMHTDWALQEALKPTDKKAFKKLEAEAWEDFLDMCVIQAGLRVYLNISDLLKSKKAVVLGDPGSGKSTLLKYLAYKLSTKPEEISELKDFLPILFSVADYAILQREKELSLEEYLKQRFSDFWPIFEESIKANKALFLIDGLDEEIDSEKRIQVVRAIEEFVSKYPENRYIVTSRIVGYSVAPLSLGFDHFIISPFNEKQIFEFLLKWCEAIGDGKEAKVLYDIIKNNPSLFKLATNPLLLTIMALLHHQGGARLPYRRVDLYTYIIDALAETWNRVRSLSGRPIDLWLGPRRLDRHLAERILAPIAFEVHQKNPGGLIEKEYLKDKVASYFIEYEGLEKSKAEQIAYDFIKLIEEQVGILIEKGIDRFAFTHLTFEEYLAARYLASLENVKEKALKYLYNPHFEEVILLTAGLLAGERAEGFVKAIYEYDGELDKVLKRSLIMAARCLGDEADVRFELKKKILENLKETILTTPYKKLAEEIASVYASLYRSSLRNFIEPFICEKLLDTSPELGCLVLEKLREVPLSVIPIIKKWIAKKQFEDLKEFLNTLQKLDNIPLEIISTLDEKLEVIPIEIKLKIIELRLIHKDRVLNKLSIFEKLLEDKDPLVRIVTASIVASFDLRQFYEKAVPIIKEAIKSKKPEIRHFVMYKLFIAKLSFLNKLSIPMMKSIMGKLRLLGLVKKLKVTSKYTFETLQQNLKNPDPSVRLDAIEELINLRKISSNLVKILFEMTKSNYNSFIRNRAYELLLQIALLRGHDKIDYYSI